MSKDIFGIADRWALHKKNFWEAPKHIVDLDADPFVPDDWTVEEHTKGGQFEFDQAKVALHLDEGQKDRGAVVGNKLREKLKGRPVFNAHLLDFYLRYPNFIPEEWKSKAVFFWGTIYRRSDGSLSVRYLDWNGDEWYWYYFLLDYAFNVVSPAAVHASS